jgi:hypothetical protein
MKSIKGRRVSGTEQNMDLIFQFSPSMIALFRVLRRKQAWLIRCHVE